MLNNKKKYLNAHYVLVCQNYTLIFQQDQRAKMDYHMSMLFAYMAGGEGEGARGFKMFCQRGSEYFLLALRVCVCVCEGGGGVRFNISPSGLSYVRLIMV